MAFHRPSDPSAQGIPNLVTKLADGLGKLVTDHITLAKLELSEDARAVGGEVARIAVFVPFVLVGYGLVCAAIALALAPFIGYALAFAAVGLLNVIGGGVGLVSAARRLKARSMLDETFSEVSQTTAVLAQSASGNPTRNTVKELIDGQ